MREGGRHRLPRLPGWSRCRRGGCGARLGLVLLSTLVALVVIEVALRLFVTLDLVGPVLTEYDPVYGKRFKPGFSGVLTTPEFSIRITTNSLGFRGPEPEGPVTGCVLFLGDSFTLGYGVDDGEEYPQLLAAVLRERLGASAPPVVNAAMGDAGNGHWVKRLTREAPAYRPRAVVLQVCGNDWRDNRRERLFAVGPDGVLTELPVPPQDVFRRIQTVVDGVPFAMSTRLVNLAKLVLHRARRPGPQTPGAEDAELTRALIAESLAVCRRHGWPVIMVTARVDGGKLAMVRGLCDRGSVPLVVTPRQVDRPELAYPQDRHWNAAGHAHVAARVAGFLLEVLLDATNPEVPVSSGGRPGRRRG